MSDQRIELPGGHYAVFRDVETVTNDERSKALAVYDEIPGRVAANLMVYRKLIALMVTEWDLTYPDGKAMPLPKTDLGVLGRLPIRTYDPLWRAAEALQTQLFPEFEPTKEAVANPASPFDDSNSSAPNSVSVATSPGFLPPGEPTA